MADEAKTAKLLVEVQWGIIPGTVDGNKQWGFSSEEVEAAKSWEDLMAKAYDEFARRMNPNYHNWVTLTWLWV